MWKLIILLPKFCVLVENEIIQNTVLFSLLLCSSLLRLFNRPFPFSVLYLFNSPLFLTYRWTLTRYH